MKYQDMGLDEFIAPKRIQQMADRLMEEEIPLNHQSDYWQAYEWCELARKVKENPGYVYIWRDWPVKGFMPLDNLS